MGAPNKKHFEPLISGLAVLAALVLVAGPRPVAAESSPGAADLVGMDEAVLDTSGPSPGVGWVAVEALGLARWRYQGDADWRRFKNGEVLVPGAEIETGPDGYVLLVVGGDRLILAENSHLVVSLSSLDHDHRLRHDRGRVRVDVEKRPDRDLQLRTPLLSLGIKGTSFEVAVDSVQNSVVVFNGEVAVKTLRARQPVARDLGPGEGLKQPVDAGARSIELALRDLPGVPGRTDGVRWHLAARPEAPSSSSESFENGSTPPAGDATFDDAGADHAAEQWSSSSDGAGGLSDGYGRVSDGSGGLGDWLDQRTSAMTLLLILAAAVAILVIPALLLGQNLRLQWLARPGGKGRRRRALTRD
jgi:hypothetical protein